MRVTRLVPCVYRRQHLVRQENALLFITCPGGPAYICNAHWNRETDVRQRVWPMRFSPEKVRELNAHWAGLR